MLHERGHKRHKPGKTQYIDMQHILKSTQKIEAYCVIHVSDMCVQHTSYTTQLNILSVCACYICCSFLLQYGCNILSFHLLFKIFILFFQILVGSLLFDCSYWAQLWFGILNGNQRISFSCNFEETLTWQYVHKHFKVNEGERAWKLATEKKKKEDSERLDVLLDRCNGKTKSKLGL